MGSINSKEHLLKVAIEQHDLKSIKRILRPLTDGQISKLCKSQVPNNENQCTFFHYATWQDDENLLEFFLNYTDDLEIRDGLGWTLLTTAVHRGSRENVHLLLNRGARVDSDGLAGMNLIAIAMTFPDVEIIKMLIDHGARLKSNDDQNTCHLLHFAVDRGLIDVTNLFLSKKQISIDQTNERGWTPLHLAAGQNHLAITKLLIEHGADVNKPDFNGNTPLAWANVMNAEKTAKELQQNGAQADEHWHGEQLELSQQNEGHQKGKMNEIFERNHYELEEVKPERSFVPCDTLEHSSL